MPESTADKVIPVRVGLRIRPLNPKEVGEGCQQCINIVPGRPQIVIGNDKAFTYDYVFDSGSAQENIFNQTVEPLLDGLFNGYNATVLAYGQTGSGKTFTMGTSFTLCSSEDETFQGIIPRVIKRIFYEIDSRREKFDVSLKVSFLEIHNEEIHDLLNPVTPDYKIAIRETVDGGIKISGLQEVTVSSVEEMTKCLEEGSACRVTAATAMNSRSSRSHAIYTITLEQTEKGADGDVKNAKFHLVDLAGSERAKKTQAHGDRFKEGVNINRGLLALGNVISALSDENRKPGTHVPYRDSKLTRLLQDSLGGNSNTVMVACVSPADSNLEETLNTLRYADRARQIKNKPIVNRDPVTAEIVKLRQQVQTLQMQLLQSQTTTGSYGEGDCAQGTEKCKQLEEENHRLAAELASLIDVKTDLHEKVLVMEFSNEKMVRKFEEMKQMCKRNKIEIQENESSPDELDLGKELKSKIREFEESMSVEAQCIPKNTEANFTSGQDGISNTEDKDLTGNDSAEPMDSSFVSQHALRQAELCHQLQDLSKALAMKEELAKKMVDSDKGMDKLRKQYENTVRELESEMSKLEKEKANLMLELASAKSEPSVTSKMRDRIQELEKKITELKKKQVEQEKLKRIQQQNDCTIKKLNNEIQTMKSNRVKLLKQVKEESERFRALKAEKSKEILQLKEQERKRHFEFRKKESMHVKQQNVLKRKAEEAAAVNKRLKEALHRQKDAAEKRATQQHQQNKQSDNLVPRMRSWLTHEVDVIVSVAQAKATLEEMIEDRKVISQQLSELRNVQEEADEQPPSKKMAQQDGLPCTKKDILSDVNKKIKTLELQLKLRNSEIGEMQRKLIEAGEKTKYRWKSLHTMAEAKAALQVLCSMVVEARTVCTHREKEIKDIENSISELQEEKDQVTKDLKQKQIEVTALQQEHEEKVLFLLQQVSQTNDNRNHIDDSEEIAILKQKLHFQEAQIGELGNLHDEIHFLREENEDLKEKLIKVTEAFESVTPTTTPVTEASNSFKKKKSKKATEVNSEYEEAWMSDEAEYSFEDRVENDPDWVKTPHLKMKTCKKISEENDTKQKHQSTDEGKMGCSCKGKCKRNCWCKANNVNCCGDCGCDQSKCANRTRDPSTPAILISSDDDSITQKTNCEDLSLDCTYVMEGSQLCKRNPLAEVNETTAGSSQVTDLKDSFKNTKNRRGTFTLSVPPSLSTGSSLSFENEENSKPSRARQVTKSSKEHARRKPVTSRSLALTSSSLWTSGNGLPTPRRMSYFPSPYKHKSLSSHNQNSKGNKRKLMKLSNNGSLFVRDKQLS